MYNYQPYQPYQMPQAQPQPQAQVQSGITWVQGISAAKSYLVAPGQSVLLMDSEESRFYLKSSDPSGMPMPLRVFEYKELTEQQRPQNTSEFVTRKEFDELVASLKVRSENNE